MKKHIIKLKGIPVETFDILPGFTLQKVVVSDNMMVDYDTLKPRNGTPLHRHPCEEAWFIVQGRGYIRVENEKYEFKKYDFLYVPKNVVHQLVNTGDETLTYVAIICPPIDPARDLEVIEAFNLKHLIP